MKNRIISGAILVIIFVGSLLIDSCIWAILMSIVSLLALKELIDVKYCDKNYLKMINILSSLFLLLIVLNNNYIKLPDMLIVAGLIICLLSPIVFYNVKKYNIEDALYMISIVSFLGFIFNSLVSFRLDNINLCILILGISAITDTFALIGGTLFGRHKLSKISPKKTWEGSIIGSLIGTIVGSIFYINFISSDSILSAVILSFVLTIFCEIGDLVFSSIKRYFNIKDFSNIIPGHGGILDRFDSIIFVTLGLVLIINIF